MRIWRNSRKQFNPNSCCFPEPPAKGDHIAEIRTEIAEIEWKYFELMRKETYPLVQEMLDCYARSSLTVNELNQELGEYIMRHNPNLKTRHVRKFTKLVVQDVLNRRENSNDDGVETRRKNMMGNKKTYTKERPESWKYFHAPYNIVVYGLAFVLSMVGIIGWYTGYMVSIALVAISLFSIVFYAEAHLKKRHQFCEQFFKEENISPQDYDVWQELQGKQVIFIVEPKKKTEAKKWNKR